MIKTIYPSRSATLYEATSSKNTGLDEIIEITKQVSASGATNYNSRGVLYFSPTELSTISASLSAQGIHTSSDSGSLKYYLKMFVSEEGDVPLEFQLNVHPLRESFEMGTGRTTNKPYSTNGVSWAYRRTPEVSWTDTGGYYFSGSHASESAVQLFNNVTADVEVDITDQVLWWESDPETVANYGLIIKRPDGHETNAEVYGSLKYYSRNTNTIYPPRLEVRYNPLQQTFSSINGSQISISDDIDVVPRISSEYKQGSIDRIIVDTTVKGKARSQAGSVGTDFTYYLPQSSSFAIKDNSTNEYVYKHDEVSTYIGRSDSLGNYFDLDTTGLFPERYYSIEFKVNHYGNGSVIATRYYTPNINFKVVK